MAQLFQDSGIQGALTCFLNQPIPGQQGFGVGDQCRNSTPAFLRRQDERRTIATTPFLSGPQARLSLHALDCCANQEWREYMESGLARLTYEVLGDNADAWATTATLVEEYSGTLAELLVTTKHAC